ncbi:PP2C family protein-serine/threonine phosphatase [Falsiroseomonas sp.]|uniref:PP2C family protein-serine/threonine phosphatase n=1 Tax=Falsiroseomonas sp. TaxID=2870721 RepID=UPI0034A3A534
MSLRSRILLLFALATLLVATSVAAPAWLVLRDAEGRSATVRASLQSATLREAVDRAAAPLVASLRSVVTDEALLSARARQDESLLRQRLATLLEPLGSSVRLDMVGGQGQLLAAVPAAADPMASGATALRRDLLPGQVTSGFEKAEGEVLLVASLRLAQGDLVSIGVPASEVLGQIARHLGADLLLRDLDGALQFASTASLRDSAAILQSGDTLEMDGRIFRLEPTPAVNSAGALVGEILVLADATAAIKSRRLLLLVASALLVVAATVTCSALYGVIRDALDPLTELARALQAVAGGDIFASAAVGRRGDEVGAIGDALESLRSNTMALDRLQTGNRLAGLRERVLIAQEISRLAAVLEGPARQEILGLLEGEGATLGPAFARLSGHVVQQHRAMAELLAERTRDLALVRQALDERLQFNRMREELDVARRLQLSSLPTTYPERDCFRLHAAMEPAKEVGGDFCDLVMLDENRLLLMIGDASGKGVGAAIFIAMARSLLRAAMGRGATPAEALAQANDTLAADNPTLMFATAIVAVLDCRTGVLTYANAGHNAPRRRNAGGGEGELPVEIGMALGVMDGIDFADQFLQLDAGDHLLMFTDGVTEAVGLGDAMFGDARLAAIVADAGALAPARLVEAVAQSVEVFAETEPQADDITMVALHWRGVAAVADAPAREKEMI